MQCGNNKNDVNYVGYDVFQLSEDICKYFVIDGVEYTYIKGKYCFFEDTVLDDYSLVSPFFQSNRAKILVDKIDDLGIYNPINSSYSPINTSPPFKPNLDGDVKYYNQKIIYTDRTTNFVNVYVRKGNDYIQDFSVKIDDEEIFNIYGGLNSKNILIESGYFPSGGCEYIKYHSLNLNNYNYQDVTDKILLINTAKSPIDICYYDISQEYLFLPSEKLVKNIKWIPEDDYILDSKFDTIGRALRKNFNYGNEGYNINSVGEINFYFFKNERNKLVCFPLNLDFEKQIYKIYYDSLLVKEELNNLTKIEIDLLKNTILLKNSGVIKSEKIRDILSLYAFSLDYKETLPDKSILSILKGNEMLNYRLLNSFR